MDGFAKNAVTLLKEMKLVNLRIAQDVETLIGRLVNQPTEEEQAEILAELQSNLDSLKGIDSKVENTPAPVEPVEPVEETTEEEEETTEEDAEEDDLEEEKEEPPVG